MGKRVTPADFQPQKDDITKPLKFFECKDIGPEPDLKPNAFWPKKEGKIEFEKPEQHRTKTD